MTDATVLQIDKGDLRRTRAHTAPSPVLAEGEILAAVERFALTANNVSYAKTGDALGYWAFFPAEAPWGVVPVWGFAEVTASKHPEIAVGERIYGYLPMASHLVLKPAGVKAAQFFEGAEHRQALPPPYNVYRRIQGEPPTFQGHDDARALYFPLFMTSYLLFDYLTDNAMFGARQVVIGSASSKTGFGLAKFLSELEDGPKVIGVTGARGFAEGLGCYDQLIGYDGAGEIDASAPTVYVDMSGDGALTEALHRRLADNMKASVIVGATHWEADAPDQNLPGAKPAFFFAPSQMQKRDAEWGPGVLMKRASDEALRLAIDAGGSIEVERLQGAEAVAALWRDLLDNKVSPSRGVIASMG